MNQTATATIPIDDSRGKDEVFHIARYDNDPRWTLCGLFDPDAEWDDLRAEPECAVCHEMDLREHYWGLEN